MAVRGHGAVVITLLGAALAVAACGDERHLLLVDVRTDLTPGVEFTSVRVERIVVSPADDGFIAAETYDVPALPGDDFVTDRRVAEMAELPSGRHRLHAVLRDAAGEVVLERRALLNVRADTVATLVLTRSCRGVECPEPGGDRALSACAGGQCVDPGCTVERADLCGAPSCMTAGDCPVPAAACAEALCSSGLCLGVGHDDLCAAGEACAPDVGCVPLIEVPDCAGSSQITVSNLRTDWSTPNQIRWRWDRTGDDAAFDRFMLITAESMADLATGAGTARAWDGSVNPELDLSSLPGTGLNDPVVSTITDEHLPATSYVGRLFAWDPSGACTTSDVAAVTTGAPTQNELVVFSDEDTAGFSIPDTVVLSGSEPYGGTGMCYEYTSPACTGGDCFDNLRRQDLRIDTSVIPEAAFDTSAYVEFAVAIDSTEHTYWTEVRLWFGTQPDHPITSLHGIAHWTTRAGRGYRLHQFPLRNFARESQGALPYSTFVTGLFEFGLGGRWASGAVVRFDEIRIRW